MPAQRTIVQCKKPTRTESGPGSCAERCLARESKPSFCNGPLMRIGSLFMFYCACWGSALLERLFPRLMRRFAFQTGLAILALRLVSLAFPCGALAQDAPPADSSTPVVAATAHDTDTLAQQTGADTPPASAPAPAGTEPESSDVLTLFPHSETSRYWI